MTGRLRGIEAARGLAAVLVVTLHLTSILSVPNEYGRLVFGGAFGFGRAGVDFFFVLSGFIISYVHAGDVGGRGSCSRSGGSGCGASTRSIGWRRRCGWRCCWPAPRPGGRSGMWCTWR